MLRVRWLCILLPLISTVFGTGILKESNLEDIGSTNEVISCVEEIAMKFFTGMENVLVVYGESFIAGELIRRIETRFCIYLANRKSRIDFNAVHDYIVLEDDSGKDPYEGVKNMILNPRGRYVFVTRAKPNTLRMVAAKFWNSGTPNVIFVQGSNEGSVAVFGYEASRYPTPRIRVFDRWKIGKFVNGSDLFPSKFTDMEKRPLKVTVVSTLQTQPDIFVTRSENGKLRISGVGSNLLNLFAKKLNFKVVVLENFYYGHKENGTWNGPRAQLIRGDADLTFAGLMPTLDMIEDFEYSEFYRWDAFHFVMKSAGRTVSWKSLFNPFSPTIWIYELFVLLATFCLVYVVRKFHFLNIVNEHVKLIDVLRVLWNQSVRYPKSSGIRLAFALLLFHGYLMSACYNSSLINSLSMPIFGRNPETFEELAKSKIEIGGILAFKKILGDTGDPVDREIHDRFVNLTFRDFWPVLAAKDRALVLYRTSAIRHNWRYRLNESMQLRMIEDPIVGLPFLFYMRKGHPYREPLNNFIRQIRSSGLIVKWMSDYNAAKIEKRNGNEQVVLTLEHYALVFIHLVCCYIISTLRFFHELYF